MNKLVKFLILSATTLILVACGGGGSDTGIKQQPQSQSEDTTPPIITIEGGDSITIIVGSSFNFPKVTAYDAVDGTVDVTRKSGFSSFNSNKIGRYELQYSAVDFSRNSTTKTLVVNVVQSEDTTPPIITIEGSNRINLNVCTPLHLPTVMAIDNQDATVEVLQWDGFDTFDVCKIGEHTFTYRAVDSSGNSVLSYLYVNVIGIELILTDGNKTTVYQYSDDYVDAGYSAKSSFDDNVIVKRNGNLDVDTLGDYVLTYIATDGKGNTRTVTRTVSVVSNPYINIQHVSNVTSFRKALENASINGKDDVILIATGTYKTTEDGQGTFDFNDNEAHKLRIYGEINSTILDGDNTDRVLDFDNTNDGDIILKHLNIQNAKGDGISSGEYLVLDDCKVHNNIGHGINAKVGTKIVKSNIYNNIYVGDSSNSGGGVYSYGETIIIDSKIHDNISEYRGGGIYSSDNLNMYDSEVYRNIARGHSTNFTTGYGGGVFISSGDYSIIYNTSIHHNIVVQGDGGGVYNNSSEYLYISKSKIYANKAEDEFGGIKASKLYIYESEICDNNASEQGGIYADRQINIYDSNVTGNISKDHRLGAGISIFYGNYYTSIINGCNISNNKVMNNETYPAFKKIYGVGVYAYRAEKIIIENSIITNNKALFNNGGDAYGTAVFTSDSVSSFVMFNNTIINNTSVGANNTYGTIYGEGKFYNNIIDKNIGTINFQGDSEVYNNYVDYTSFLNENTYTVIKKGNIVPQQGDSTYDVNYELFADSILIDKGVNPTSTWWDDEYYNDLDFYNEIINNLKKDKKGNLRDDGLVDIGAYEYQP